MTIMFHPKKPFLLVGGGFNGEIFIWDLSLTDPLIHES